MISDATKRSILRWTHIVFGIPIIGYVYSPFEELPNYAPVVRFVSIPVLVLTGLWMWKGHVLRRLFSKRSAQQNFMGKKINKMKKELPPKQREELLKALKARFEENINRHKGLEWPKVQARLEAHSEKLWSLNEMESTGGEPDVVGFDKKTGEFIFYDCSAESPNGRRSICYDREGQESRKEHKPENNAL